MYSQTGAHIHQDYIQRSPRSQITNLLSSKSIQSWPAISILSPNDIKLASDFYKTERGTITHTASSGLFPKISSTVSKIAGVNFGMTASAFRLSVTCSGLDAPRMTVEVLGLVATHAKAR